MRRTLVLLCLGLPLAATCAMASAQTCPYQGIYEGKELLRVDNQPPAYFLSRLTVLPDGHSIIITSEVFGRLGNKYIVTRVATGSFNANVFTGFNRGRFNLGSYGWSGTYTIRFVGEEARVMCSSINTPAGFVHDPREDHERIFYRVKS